MQVLVLLQGPVGAAGAPSSGEPPASHTRVIQLKLPFLSPSASSPVSSASLPKSPGRVFKVELLRSKPGLPTAGSPGLGL